MTQKLPWTPWHEVVELREDVRTGELSLADFAADLHDVVMQKGTRPVYEDPGRFFALTFPTFPLRELARDVALRLAGRNTKAIRQLELTYGGGKTHTLVTLRHLVHKPEALPALSSVDQFKSHVGTSLPAARIAALCFDKLDVEKGMEVRGPAGELRWVKHPWSVLAFQIAGDEGLCALHPDGANEERETPPAEPLLADLLAQPQAHGLATLVLIDEVLMYAREKVAMAEEWRGRLIGFFQSLCQAVVKVDRCALVASLLASDPAKSDAFGKELTQQIFDIFSRQREEGVQPVQKQDVAEVLRRRFFTSGSIADPDSFRPHVTAAVANIARVDETVRKDRANAEQRYLDGYPFHPDLTDIFYTKWTQLDGFQRTRGILRTFAVALRDAETWDTAPLVGPNVFLPAPGDHALAEAARELAGIATREVTESAGNVWSAVLEGEFAKARTIQDEQPALKSREMEQAVLAAFLNSQPIGQKAHTPELIALVGATRPDRIELEKGLRRWTDLSWFLDESEFSGAAAMDDGSGALPKAWRLGNRPNLKQMHHDACTNRVTAELVEQKLLAEVRRTRSLTQGASGADARVHTLPERPRDIEDDGEFHFALLGPGSASDSGRPSAQARRFIDETTGPDRPRTRRNAILLVVPSRDGLDVARVRIREYLGWEEVRSQIGEQAQDTVREAMLAMSTEQARRRIPDAIRQAWSIVVTVSESNAVHAFKATIGAEPLFPTIKADRRARVQETAISAEAMLPGGPYDLWRAGEPSRRVKDLAGAFAENPKLPKMLRRKEILDTIDQGVLDGIFVASLIRPDKSVKTWWRTRIDEAVRAEPALELCLPDKATLSELVPNVLAPGVLPELWVGESVAVADVIAYFAGGRAVIVQREGYSEPVAIPACPRTAIEAAISDAVRQGVLWLVNGPASFQGEPVAPGVLTDAAQLRAPMLPLAVDQLTKDAVPEAWTEGETNALALSAALSVRVGAPVPWPVLCRAIDDALGTRWLEQGPDSGPWPCEAAGASAVRLKQPDARKDVSEQKGDYVRTPKGAHTGGAILEPNELQDLSDALPEVVKAAAGVPLQFHVRITLGDGSDVPSETVTSLNELLEGIKSDFRLSE
ncbi:MAG: DUF499 domain-containing protein [Thiotrichales bacterium]|nr:DUF499 domain-containing protein [Thiotrichales bacterium]